MTNLTQLPIPLIHAPGSTLVLSDSIKLVGTVDWNLELELAPLSGSVSGRTRCAYLWEGGGEFLVLAPILPTDEGTFSIAGVPAGRGRIVKIDPTDTILDPREWETVQDVVVASRDGAEIRIVTD